MNCEQTLVRQGETTQLGYFFEWVLFRLTGGQTAQGAFMQHRRRQSIFQAAKRAFNAHHPKPEQRAKPVQAVSGR